MTSTHTLPEEPAVGAMPEKKDVQPREWLIVIIGVLSVGIVIAYEYVKASHEVDFDLTKPINWHLTRFWFLDIAVAGIVTFALVWVALSFRRMEKLLDRYEDSLRNWTQWSLNKHKAEAEVVSSRLTETQSKLTKLQDDLQNVAEGITAKGSIIQDLDTPIMRQAYDADSSLRSSIIQSLQHVVAAWRDLLQDEFSDKLSIINGVNYGLLCWKAALPKYMAEEATDLKARTVATNIGLYLGLIEAIVESVLGSVDQTSTTVELFASANIFPVEYYNWRDDSSREERHPGMIGISRFFMDDYRSKIGQWLNHAKAPTLTRVFLVNKIRDEIARRDALAGMAIQDFSSLKDQARLKILCDKDTGKPRKMRVSDIARYIDERIPQWLVKEHGNEHAYAIGEDFSVALGQGDDLVAHSLFEVVIKELHSNPPGGSLTSNNHARYLLISDEESIKHLELLPKVPTRLGEIRSPDFLAIRVKTANRSQVVACIATQLDPDYETMALTLITRRQALEAIEKFITYAAGKSHPLGSMVVPTSLPAKGPPA